jgi:hypothetical protein
VCLLQVLDDILDREFSDSSDQILQIRAKNFQYDNNNTAGKERIQTLAQSPVRFEHSRR